MKNLPDNFQFANRRTLRLSSPLTRYLALLVDVALVALVGLLTYNAYHDVPLRSTHLPLSYKLVIFSAGALLGFFVETLYRSWRLQNLMHMLRVLLMVWLGVMGIEVIGLFLTKSATDI